MCFLGGGRAQELINTSIEACSLLGAPPSLTYHKGWKKWRVDLGESGSHTFVTKEAAMAAHVEWAKLSNEANLLTVKDMNAQLIAGGQKCERLKPKVVEAFIRLKLSSGAACTCCGVHKAG